MPASPGAASGIAVFDPDVAEQRGAAGEAVVLVREETTPEDFHGIVAARAIVTARGGMTSHAAVVAAAWANAPCVGCKELHVDEEHRRFSVNGTIVQEGDWMTVDGATGAVYSGALPTVPSEVMRVVTGSQRAADAPLYQAFASVLEWADAVRRLRVRANADTPRDAASRERSARRGSGSAAPSTCSSRATGSPPCAR